MESLVCFVAVIVLVAMVVISISLRIVPEYQRLVVFRLGRALDGPRGPGVVFLIPSIDRAVKVDLREQERDAPSQTGTTKDYKVVSFDFRWSYKVLDPVKSVLEVANLEAVTAGVASTRFRELVHEVNAADLASERERIRYMVNSRLDEVTGQWGIKVTKFEIIDIVVDELSK